MKAKAIIPFKKEGAKSRLYAFLTEEESRELAVRMLTDVLVALSESEIEEVGIISTCSEEELIEDLRSNPGFDSNSELGIKQKLNLTVREDGKGLNEVLNEVIKEEKVPLLILMADLPLVTSSSINKLIEQEGDIVIAPGRKGGTNALFLRRHSDFFVSYYGVSYLEHIETAKRMNLSHAVCDSFFISTDIDEVDDLIELLIHGRGFSAEYLRNIGVFIHVDKKLKMRAKVDRQEK